MQRLSIDLWVHGWISLRRVARRNVYVSCDPATLAQSGCRLECVQPVGMFAQTHHIGWVALLTDTRR